MSWFRLDDKSTFHRKVVSAGNAAWGALCRMGTHSSDQLLDGFVPREVAILIASTDEIASLVRTGLLSEEPHGYVIHDFLDWNPSARDVLKSRKDKAKAGRSGGQASAQARAVAPAQAAAQAPASALLLPTEQQSSSSRARVPSHPIPSHPKEEETVTLSVQPAGDPGIQLSVVSTTSPVREVFDYWVVEKKRICGGREPEYSEKRQSVIRARLAKYSVDEIKQAIDGMLSCEHNLNGKYTGIEVVCRNDEKLEMYIEKAADIDPRAPSKPSVLPDEGPMIPAPPELLELFARLKRGELSDTGAPANEPKGAVGV
jgi:hypothetical protein